MSRNPLPDPTVVLTCSKCGVSGRACDLFYFYKSGPKAGAVTQAHCKTCEYERVQEHKQRRPKFGPPVPKGARLRTRPQRPHSYVVVVDGVECKACTRCGETLSLERFTKQKRKDGRVYIAGQCKDCRTKFEKAQRLAGKRIIKDPERTKAVSDAWRKGPGLEKARMGVRRRRARLRDAGPMVTLNEWLEIQAAWKHCCAYCGVHAPGELTMDHVIPVVRAEQFVGGNVSAVENIAPACGPKHNNCNARKAARTGMEFVWATDGSGPLRAVA